MATALESELNLRLCEEARNTYQSTPRYWSALAACLLSLQTITPFVLSETSPHSLRTGSSSDTYSYGRVDQSSWNDLYLAINRIYDEILTSPAELDQRSKEILYSNLWDLYE